MATVQNCLAVNFASLAAFYVAHRQAVTFMQKHGFARAAAHKHRLRPRENLAHALPFKTAIAAMMRSVTIPVDKLP